MNDLTIKDLGLIPYFDAYSVQNKIFAAYTNKKSRCENISGTLLFCEHPHVYTIGKSGKRENLLISKDQSRKYNIEFFETDRGGDITYHGPGQIVMYPIIDLDKYGLGVKDYIYLLEFMIIDILKEYGIEGEVSTGNIGVWIGTGTNNERKICSIGIKVSRKITMHGIALNVNTDLSYFNYINPCGFTEKGVTSLKNELLKEIKIKEIKEKIKHLFVERLNSLK